MGLDRFCLYILYMDLYLLNDFYLTFTGEINFSLFNFYAPEIEDRGAYCFCPVCHSVILSFRHSVILSFCNSVILSSSLKL